MIEERPPPAAPHTPSDDPRVDILAAQLCSTPGGWRAASDTGARIARDAARDLLARLDAAAPARDAALARWLDGEIDKVRAALRAAEREADLIDLVDDDSAVGADEYVRWQTLREVRDRLGATTEGVRDA